MKIRAQPDLSALTTLRIGGKAFYELVLENAEDFCALDEKIRRMGGKPFPLGKGSNLLARDGELPLLLIKIEPNGEPEIIARDGDNCVVKASAGTSMPGLLRFCLENNLAGLENFCGIPGSVGGSAAMNAGSFGSEMGDVISGIEIWDGSAFKMIHRNEIRTEYRKLFLPSEKESPLIVNVFFALTHAGKGDIFKRMSHNFFEKKSRQPVEAKSAGCVFKNPANAPTAGQLLDKAGFRGKRHKGMAFSRKHANFLINETSGTATAALELLDMAKNTVMRQFGIELQEEVRVIPDMVL